MNSQFDSAEGANAGKAREPAFNLPAAILWLSVVLIGIHLVRSFFLTPQADIRLIIAAAFIPARYGELASQIPYPAAAYWSPLTYTFLHGNWTHLWMNVFWMAAFGSPVARRLGILRFTAISLVSTIAGIALHYVFHIGEMVPVIGASAMVSGFMGAAARFIFNGRSARGLNIYGPSLTLIGTLTNRSSLIFLAVWFAMNLLFGTGIVSMGGIDSDIAWQAHIGGFLGGILIFSMLDRSR